MAPGAATRADPRRHACFRAWFHGRAHGSPWSDQMAHLGREQKFAKTAGRCPDARRSSPRKGISVASPSSTPTGLVPRVGSCTFPPSQCQGHVFRRTFGHIFLETVKGHGINDNAFAIAMARRPFHHGMTSWVRPLAVLLVIAQGLLPLLHTQHLASHHGPSSHHASACCHGHHQHQEPSSPDEDRGDDSCPTCLSLISAKQIFLTPDAPLIALIEVAPTRLTIARTFVAVDCADLTIRTPRGPPHA